MVLRQRVRGRGATLGTEVLQVEDLQAVECLGKVRVPEFVRVVQEVQVNLAFDEQSQAKYQSSPLILI